MPNYQIYLEVVRTELRTIRVTAPTHDLALVSAHNATKDGTWAAWPAEAPQTQVTVRDDLTIVTLRDGRRVSQSLR